jgi:hypothetical protein
MNKRTIGIVGTLLIHLSVLLYLLWPSVHSPPPPPRSTPEEPKPVQVRLIPKRSLSKELKPGQEPGINGAPDPRICENKDLSYEGIGIIHSYGTELVTSAPAEYPAYRAGVRVGDMIIDLHRIEGTRFMFFRLNRHGVYFTFKVPIENICFNKD